jgi:hypothetical protein
MPGSVKGAYFWNPSFNDFGPILFIFSKEEKDNAFEVISTCLVVDPGQHGTFRLPTFGNPYA